MYRIPAEILYRIADFLRPSGIQGSREYESGLDLLNLMKTCRGFYEVLLGYWHRALFEQLGSDICLQRAASYSSARALELIYSIATRKFPISDGQLYTCIIQCIVSGRYEPFTWLLQKHKDLQINVIKIEQCRILYIALRAKDNRMLFHLLSEADEGIIHTRQQGTGYTLLAVAIELHQTKEVICHLLQYGFGISQKIPSKFNLRTTRGAHAKTHLELAFELKSLGAIEAFIEYDGQQVNQILSTPMTYLELLELMFTKDALYDKSRDIFQLAVMIFDIVPDANPVGIRFRKAGCGKAVLRHALAGSWWEVAQLVMQHGMGIDYAPPFNRSIFTTAFLSLNDDRINEDIDITTLKMLLEKGADIDFGLINGTTLLHSVRKVELAQFLIDHGFDVNVRNENGWTPLHQAILSGNGFFPKWIEIGRLLVSHGADINSCNNVNHETPLMTAVLRRSSSFMKFLLECGAHADIADAEGRTPVMVALKYKLTFALDTIFAYSN